SALAPQWDAPFTHGLAAFAERFWNESAGCLYDVIDVDHLRGKTDASIRPNQIFAMGGLPYPIIEGERSLRALQVVEESLLTPIGLRTLARGAEGYALQCCGS